MKGLLWLLIFCALDAVFYFTDASLLLTLPPYYSVHAPLYIAFIALVAGFFILYLLLRLITLPRRLREFFLRRKSEKGQDTFDEAYRLFLEGDFKKSLKKATSAFDAGHSPAASALLAVRSARCLRDEAALKTWVGRASEIESSAQIVARMTEAELMIERGQYDQAALTLNQMKDIASLPKIALWLELKAQQGLDNSEEILKIARLLEKHAPPPPESVEQTESLAAIKTAAHRDNLRRHADDAKNLQAWWKTLPKDEIVPALLQDYCAALLALGVTDGVRKLLETQIDREWHSGLAALYGDLPCDKDLPARLERAEKWRAAHEGDCQLLLALARMARSIDPNKARIYLSSALAQNDCRDVRFELARLAETEGNTDEALLNYRAAIGFVPPVLPDKAATSTSP